ncbi:MAG: GGDEF domain-containing protein, partial [Oscillibacter sp.]|nr:GGDEF domain-containing protein [Oscillibacter sp.]
RHEAEHDPLTSLYNRGTFDKMREEYKNLPIALMLIDVDFFKQINDSHGHETGDQVLQKIARLLDKNFRDTDFPCRIGGDEFAVIMTDAVPPMKDLVREKIHRITQALQDTSDGVPAVTLSVGVAFNDRENGTEDIYKDADRALYVVKTHGRNGVEFYGEYYAQF